MEEYLICAHFYYDSSPEDLSEQLHGDDIGLLHYAAKITGPTYAEAKEMLAQNQLVALSRYGAPLKCLDLYPFVSEADLDDRIEYYATQFDIFTVAAATKLWKIHEVGKALNEFNDWLLSADAALEKPTNRECDMLRRCVNEAALIAGLRANSAPAPRKNPAQPKKVGDKAYQKEAIRQLTLDTIAQRIIEAALNNEKIPLLKHVAKEMIKEGIWKQSLGTLQNMLVPDEAPAIHGLLKKAKARPKDIESREYRKWRKGFEERAQEYTAAILKRSDEGLTEEDRITKVSKKTGKIISERDENKKKDENGPPRNPPTT